MATYTPNHAGIRRMLGTPAMVAAMRHRVERMKAYAEAIAPVDTGEYKASFRTASGVRNGIAYGRLSNVAPHAIYVEFPHRAAGSDRVIAGQHILGRSIDALRAT